MRYRLDSCVWEITLACCFSCKYCGSGAGKARDNELTTAECLDVARQLAELGCRRVSMIGGEVFMRPDWQQIVRALTGRGVRVAIITNGFLFHESLLSALTELNVESVAVSIDGTEAVHDKYRCPGSYRRAMNAIDALTSHGIIATVITTLNAENAAVIGDLYTELTRRGIAAWQLQACSPMGNARTGIDVRFDPRAVIRFVRQTSPTAPFAIGIADNIGYYTPDERYIRGDLSGHRAFPGCAAGLSSIGIDSIGNVRGCESMYDERFIEGNLRDTALRAIWESPTAFLYNRGFDRSMLTGACADCAYGAYCAGGCRSYNYFSHGRLYEHPACARNLSNLTHL